MEITSKRHPYKFYLSLIFYNLFFLGMGVTFLLASIRDKKDIDYYIFFVIITVATFLNIGYFKNAPIIILSNLGLMFKKKLYLWDELSSPKLTGKGDMIFTSQECATLTFGNTKTIKIFDDFYSNISEMKCFIQELVIDKKEKIEISIQENDMIDIDREVMIYYKGNPLFSFRGLLMRAPIMYIVSIPFFSIKSINIKELLFFTPFFLIWFIMNSWMMCFFEISKKYFVVRNYYFFWIKKVFYLSEIEEVVFEQQRKQANKLKIITRTFNSKSYLAGSLTDKTWLAMKNDLDSKNIIVRNECIPEN